MLNTVAQAELMQAAAAMGVRDPSCKLPPGDWAGGGEKGKRSTQTFAAAMWGLESQLSFPTHRRGPSLCAVSQWNNLVSVLPPSLLQLCNPVSPTC